jgi:DNA-binding transcriptional ArsR family regulator
LTDSPAGESVVPARRVALPSARVIRIELTDDDLSRTRLALSPLWELVASLFVLQKEQPPAEYAPWVARARRALRGVELGPLDLSVPFGHSCPDFVAPIPVEPLLAGPAAVLDELHPSVRWRRPVFELHKKNKNLDLRLEGRPLVLVPLVFAGSVLLANQEAERAIGIGYQARGTAELWSPDGAGDGERLDLLLGHGRANVLRALERPATTTELAARLSYAPSTVSAHLDVLARAGLVDRHRVRRSVFYGLNETGTSLVALLADVPEVLSA